ncbi:transglycosylase domain-containing protein [Actinoplanes sp. NPDC020271]|uniref:transglycosylase domain-containing protein n=1 Tax=Actinoplanes sp. NPDC020271 TaxID=3363896 RepID=UPI0037B7E5D8
MGAAPVGGRASVGSASPGRASVGAASVGAASVGARASVGAAGVGGRASVPPPGSGGGGGGVSGGGGGKRPRSKADKKYRRANILTAAAAVLVILIGAGIVGGTYFFDDVELPTPQAEEQMNVIKNAQGQILAKEGEPRINVPYQNISKVMSDAVAAAEDKNFYHHNGIDMKGIARAAWNNFTGGDKQGASTITQQYARHVAELKDISYSRKLREAVIARKLESKYSKDQIMGLYLNYIDLGEGRYGAEAAAQGYFGKTIIKDQKDPKTQITPYEAAVIASIIKQPYPTASHQGYDPLINPAASKERWEYTMKNMLDMGAITQAQYDARKYPEAKKKSAACNTCADNKPVGMIMRHVTNELHQLNITDDQIKKGGLTIVTTIDKDIQAAAEAAGSASSKTSPLNGRSKDFQSAVIGIDPNTGEVLGYYGGDDPNGIDYAGYMSGDGSGVMESGGQSPASSFKIYTLSAALKANYSFKTLWDGEKERVGGGKISNAGQDNDKTCNDGGHNIRSCDLEQATVKSYNFPFYWIADQLGASKVVAAAKAAGINYIWNNDGKRIDLNKTDASAWGSKNFSDEIGFGQFRVLPLDHATGVATIVAQGVRHQTHFIKSITSVDPATGKLTSLKTISKSGTKVFDSAQMSDLTAVLEKIPDHAKHPLANGRDAIGKSGSWELSNKESNKNGDAWFVGGIPQLAATVWVGGKGNRVALTEANGKKMFGSNTPAEIWKDFLDAVAKKKDWDKAKFPDRIPGGDDSLGNGQALPVQQPVQQDNSAVCNGPTAIAALCPGLNPGNTGNTGDNSGNNNGGGNNNGNNDGGGNNNGNNDGGGNNNGG